MNTFRQADPAKRREQMPIVAIMIVLAALCGTATRAVSPQATKQRGAWGAAARAIQAEGDSSPSDISSPDGTFVVKQTSDGLAVARVNGSPIDLSDIPFAPWLTEVLWSSDSLAFAVTASEGGWVGTWDAYIYSLDSTGQPVKHDVRSLIAPSLTGFPRCASVERAGIGAVAWLDGGKQLLVVAEVPRHSSCRNMGAVRGFLISAREWKVLAEVPAGKLRSEWAQSLGSRLLNQP